MTDVPERELLCVVDPMCSWCWGFEPVLERLAATYADQAPVSLIVGGLRPYTTEPMTDRAKTDIAGHWRHVQEASGQPFDFSFFERDGFVYDTEPAGRALVVARHLDPTRALAFLKAVQKAFYAENRDVTRAETLGAVAEEAGYDSTAFNALLDTEEARAGIRMDYQVALNLGVSGFPTLVARKGEEYAYATVGYRPWEALQPLIDGWLAEPRQA